MLVSLPLCTICASSILQMYKRRLDMMSQQQPQHHHHPQQQQQLDQRGRIMDCSGQKGAPSSSSSYVPPVDDLSCSSISDTGSEQDWLSPTSAAKRARLSFDAYGASGPSASSPSNQHQQLLGHPDPTGNHRVRGIDRIKRLPSLPWTIIIVVVIIIVL